MAETVTINGVRYMKCRDCPNPAQIEETRLCAPCTFGEPGAFAELEFILAPERRGGSALALVLLLVATSGIAQASPAREARKLYQAAVIDFEAGRLHRALEGFGDAYSLVPDPVLVYNVAQCQRLMGRYREAVASYQKYLRLAPSAPNRATVSEHLRKLDGFFTEARQIADRASVYYAQGKYESALAAALRCTEGPEWAQCWKIVGGSRCKLGQPPGEALVRVDVEGAQLLRLPTVCGAMEVSNVP